MIQQQYREIYLVGIKDLNPVVRITRYIEQEAPRRSSTQPQGETEFQLIQHFFLPSSISSLLF